MAEVADSDILVHWLELNLSRRLVGKVYGSHQCPRHIWNGRRLQRGLMPSSTSLMVSSHNRTPCGPSSPLPTAHSAHIPGPATGPHPCPSLHAASHQCW